MKLGLIVAVLKMFALSITALDNQDVFQSRYIPCLDHFICTAMAMATSTVSLHSLVVTWPHKCDRASVLNEVGMFSPFNHTRKLTGSYTIKIHLL